MRLLLVPRIEVVDGRGSLSLVPMSLIQAGLELSPDSHITLAVASDFANDRSWLKNYLWLSDDLLKRVELLDLGTKRKKARHLSHILGAFIGPLIQPSAQRCFDAVITTAFPAVHAMRIFLDNYISLASPIDVPVIGWDVYTPLLAWKKFDSHHTLINEYEALAEMYGAASCDSIIYESNRTKKGFYDMYSQYLSGAAMSKIMGKSSTIHSGTWFEKIFPRKFDSDRKVITPNVLWTGYWNVYGEDCWKVLADLHVRGKIGRVFLHSMGITTGKTADIPEEITKQSFVTVLEMKNKWEDYIKEIKNADIVLGYSKEGYGTKYLDPIAAGLLPVLNVEMADTLLWKGYPISFSGTSGISGAILKAINIWRRDIGFCDEVYNYVKEHHNRRTEMSKLWNTVQTFAQKFHDDQPAGILGDLAIKALEKIDTITHEDACNKISQESKSKIDLKNSAMFPKICIRHAILKAGFKDVGETEPLYLRA